MNTRKLKRLERAIDELFNSDNQLLHTEVVMGVYLTMMIESVEDVNQPMLSFNEIKDTLLHADVPLNLKLAVRKQLLEQGYVDDEVIFKLTKFIIGEK